VSVTKLLRRIQGKVSATIMLRCDLQIPV